MNTKEILADKRKATEEAFGELETKRQHLLKQQGELTAELMRLQGEARVLEQLEKELED